MNMISKLVLMALLTSPLACGDDASPSENDAGGTTTDADVMDTDAMSAPLMEGKALFVAGDYAGNGITSLLDVEALTVQQNIVAGVAGGDPTVRRRGDHVFVLDRFGGDSLTVLDAKLELLFQVSTGAGSNPQDVAVIGDTAYVVTFDGAELVSVSLTESEPTPVMVGNLASLDVDGVPDCNAIEAVGSMLYVSCELINRDDFSFRGNGVVAVIDSTTGDLQRTITLNHPNPFGWMARGSERQLFVSTVPNFGDTTEGCLELINTDSSETTSSCVGQNSELGGYVGSMTYQDDTLFTVVTESFSDAALHAYDGATWSSIYNGSNMMNPTDIAACSDSKLIVADNNLDGRGARVFNVSGEGMANEVTTSALNVGWPDNFGPTRSVICW